VWAFTDNFEEDFHNGFEGVQFVSVEAIQPPGTDYELSSVSFQQEEDKDLNLLQGFFMAFLGIAMLCSAVCFVEVLLSVRKKKIFIRHNVYRMRIIAYTVIAGILYSGVEDYFAYQAVRQMFDVPGYQMGIYTFPFGVLMIALLFAVFTEVYAQGVEMKEGQELTV